MNDDMLLDDDLGDERSYPIASLGKRFVNFIIDYVVATVLMMFVYLAIDLSGAAGAVSMLDDDSTILPNVFGIIVYIIYYTICEALLKGKTIGKFATRTRAIHIGGERLTPSAAAIRSISRLAPFEQFSVLFDDNGRGWHDKWSDTMVVDESK